MRVTFDEMEQLLEEIKNTGTTTSVEIDGDIYKTDWGYGEEAIEHFIEILKKRKKGERTMDVYENDTHEKMVGNDYVDEENSVAANICHHANPKTYSDILESFVHSYNLFMYSSDSSVPEYSSKEELFDKYIGKIKEVGQ